MSKSILVIDTPDNCDECILSCEYTDGAGEIYLGENICYGCREHNLNSSRKPDWCPLRDLPKKLDEDIEDYEGMYYVGGWNECIDEILKGANDND